MVTISSGTEVKVTSFSSLPSISDLWFNQNLPEAKEYLVLEETEWYRFPSLPDFSLHISGKIWTYNPVGNDLVTTEFEEVESINNGVYEVSTVFKHVGYDDISQTVQRLTASLIDGTPNEEKRWQNSGYSTFDDLDDEEEHYDMFDDMEWEPTSFPERVLDALLDVLLVLTYNRFAVMSLIILWILILLYIPARQTEDYVSDEDFALSLGYVPLETKIDEKV